MIYELDKRLYETASATPIFISPGWQGRVNGVNLGRPSVRSRTPWRSIADDKESLFERAKARYFLKDLNVPCATLSLEELAPNTPQVRFLRAFERKQSQDGETAVDILRRAH